MYAHEYGISTHMQPTYVGMHIHTHVSAHMSVHRSEYMPAHMSVNRSVHIRLGVRWHNKKKLLPQVKSSSIRATRLHSHMYSHICHDDMHTHAYALVY